MTGRKKPSMPYFVIALIISAIITFWSIDQSHAARDVNVVNFLSSQPFQQDAATPIAGGPTGDIREVLEFDPVPEGKRLAVQYVSVSLQLNIGSNVRCLVAAKEGFSTVFQHWLPVEEAATLTVFDFVTVSTPVVLFAEAGQTVEVECRFTQQVSGGSMQAGISGGLVEE